MTAQVHAIPRAAGGGQPPLVPSRVDVQDAPDFRFNIARMLDSDWYHSCSKEEALAGINLHARAIHQLPAGSLPGADNLLARLADFGRDVDGWLGVKAKALEGWVMCSDGRWYHPDVARNALHIWVGRLEKRRSSAFANAKQCPARDFGMDEIEEDLLEAHQALRSIDPQDPVLRESTARLTRWRASRDKLTLVASENDRVGDLDPSRVPTRGPTRVPLDGPPQDSSAKLSSESISPDLRSGDSRQIQNDESEIEQAGRLEQPVGVVPSPRKPEVDWPPDPVDRLRPIYPKWKNPADVEKALASLRKGGRTPFATILAGAEREREAVRDGVKQLQFVAYPARWLRARGWENDPDPPPTDLRARAGPGARFEPQRNPHFAFAESLLEHDP